MRKIFSTFCATLMASNLLATNGSKLEPFYKNIVLNYVTPSVIHTENVAEFLKKFELTNKSSKIALEELRTNPFPIKSASDAKLLPKLETQVIFDVDDYLVPYVENVKFNIPVNIYDLYDLMDDESKTLLYQTSSKNTTYQSLTIRGAMKTPKERYFVIYSNDNKEPWKDTNLKFTNITTDAYMFDEGEIVAVRRTRQGRVAQAYDFYQLRDSIINITKGSGKKSCFEENEFSIHLILSEPCYGLKSLEIPKDVESISTEVDMMASFFIGYIPPMWNNVIFNYEQSKLKHIGKKTFASCQKVKQLDVPNTVERIDYCAFSYCRNLTTLILPDMLKTFDRHIFSGCVSLNLLAVPDKFKVFYTVDKRTEKKDISLYFINEWKINNVASIVVDNYENFIDQLKVYRKSDTLIKKFENGEFTVEPITGTNILKHADDVIKTEGKMVMIPEGISILDEGFMLMQTPKMNEAWSLKLPSTLREIRKGACLELLIGRNIHNVFIPATIQLIEDDFLYVQSLRKVTIYGGTPKERENARRLVEENGIDRKIEFVDNI